MKLINKLPLALSIATILSVSAVPAFAGNGNGNNGNGNGNGNTSQGDNNGKPFQELQQLIDSNRALIEANQTEIANLKLNVDDLDSAISTLDGQLSGLETQVTTQLTAIATIQQKMAQNQADIDTLKAELITLYQQVSGNIDSIKQQLAALSGDITVTLAQLKTSTELLQGKVAELEQNIELNAIGIDGLTVQILSMVTEVNTLSVQAANYQSAYQTLTTQVQTLESQLPIMQGQILSMQEAIITLGEGVGDDTSLPTVDACFVINNTSEYDLKGNRWFDQCINTVGEDITVVLKDIEGNVVYQASGKKRGDWTYDKITSTASNTAHWSASSHDRKVFLDNGDHLLVSGRNAYGRSCEQDQGNGYVLSIQDAEHSADRKLIIAPYKRDGSSWGQTRFIHGWSASHEISWDNGDNMYACSNYNSSKNPVEAFIGSFEVYVY